jgi:hypothetical protein
MSEIQNWLAYLSIVWILLVGVFPQERNLETGHYWVIFPENFRQFGPKNSEIWFFLWRLSIFLCKLGNLEKNGHSSPHGSQRFFFNFLFASIRNQGNHRGSSSLTFVSMALLFSGFKFLITAPQSSCIRCHHTIIFIINKAICKSLAWHNIILC